MFDHDAMTTAKQLLLLTHLINYILAGLPACRQITYLL